MALHTNRAWQIVFTCLALLILTTPVLVPAAAQSVEKISRPGVYQGYSEPIYEEWVRVSQYVAVRDGTRLAVDIFRPAVNGQPVDDPLPVIWTHHRYHRANVNADGTVQTILDDAPGLKTMIRYGYVIAAVDVRGGGASFGTRAGEFTPVEAQDAYDITEWFAAQPWCSGKVGMYGPSYLGITQYFAASTQPPHLKAIFPMMAMFDLYEFVYPGGVFKEDFVRSWGRNTLLLDKIAPAAPVDEDQDGALLKQAVRQHRDNQNIYALATAQPYRDSLNPSTGTRLYTAWSPSTYLDAINGSGVAIYTLGGWYDMYPRDALAWFNNLTGPQKVIITPWSHGGSGGFDLMAEHLRWFDYWLKGIDNGIMDEPPLYFAVLGAPEGEAWRFADQWPLVEEQPTPYYLRAGPTGSVDSVNDGLLSSEAPTALAGQDDYTVDYLTTTGRTTRWTDGYGGGYGYPDMTANDEKALTYTTLPLEQDLEVTGHPVIHLWVTSTAGDGDFFVYLEEVDENGGSTYITEGVLKTSHRALTTPPWNYMDLPFHAGNEQDLAPLPPGDPVELVFDLHPTSTVFDAGHRIRVAITGADADNYQVAALDPAPTVSLMRSADHASSIVLPIIP